MKRPISIAAGAALAVLALLAASAASAARNLSSSEAPKKAATNSLNVIYTNSPNAPVLVPSNGVGIPSGKAVVTNPYNVPLFQNAGALGSGR